MGLASIARAAARVGFAVAGDAKVAVTVRSGPTNTHSIATDTTSTTWAAEDLVPDAIVYDGKEAETKGGQGPKRRDRMVLIQASAVTRAPTEESVVLFGSEPWQVAAVETDPAGATHELTCRR